MVTNGKIDTWLWHSITEHSAQLPKRLFDIKIELCHPTQRSVEIASEICCFVVKAG
jgi:hypothetical protein